MNVVTEKIKMLCADKNISVEELAEGSGLTTEQVNLIIGSEKIPSLAPLIKIARALGVRLGTFLDDSEDLGPVINRKHDSSQSVTFSSQLTENNSHMDFFSLAARKTGRHMEPFIINIKAADDGKNTSSHEGEEFLYVLEGTIVVHYGAEKYELNEGDSIYYDSIVNHLVASANGSPAKILGIVYSPM
ncbi:MAG: cupin domain-containing protein [Petrimonas sp.]|nr:cupin domain-containing protein [Petrimonas sp.]